MKPTLTASIAVLLPVLVVLFISGTSYENSATNNSVSSLSPRPAGDEFIIGSLNTGEYRNEYSYISDTLGYNLWHRYLGTDTFNGKIYPHGWTTHGLNLILEL